MGSLPSPELPSQLLRWSTGAHEAGSIVTLAQGGFGDIKNPATRRLIEQILFTRRFAPTYLAVLGVTVLLFAASHWRKKLTQRHESRPRSKKHKLSDSLTSSSSSTLQGTPNVSGKATPNLEVNEATHLLAETQRSAQPQAPLLHRAQCHATSILAYQPSPIPALTSPSNVLPQNSTALLITLFLGLNMFYLFYHTPLTIPMLFVFADRAGLLFVVNLPVLYLLAAKTNQPLKFLTGWSYEGLNIFHRRLGEWMIILAVLHSVGMCGVWYTLLRPLDFSLSRFLSTKLVLLGIASLASYLAIWGTSIGWFRKVWYESFLGMHVFLQVAALVLLFFHHPGARIHVLTSAGIWTLDRIFGRMIISQKSFIATLQVAEDGETVLLFCDIALRPGTVGSKLHLSNGWKAGQHVFITVPGIGWNHRLQAHPFTIASPAPPLKHDGTWPLQLTIRAQDGFSKQLLQYAKLHQHTRVSLDGPYGNLDALEALKTADRKFLIAGGSGIAVTYPLVWSLLVRDEADAIVSTRLTYRNGQRNEVFLRNHWSPSEIESGQLMHLWIYQHWNHDRWLTMHPRHEAMREPPVYREHAIGGYETQHGTNAWLENMQEVADLRPKSFSTRDTFEGRPDIGLELTRWVEEGHSKSKKESICVVVSGPDGLVRDTTNTVARLLLEGWNVEVFVEKFGW